MGGWWGGWDVRVVETAVMAAAACLLLAHGCSLLSRFLADRGKPDAHTSHLSRRYPGSYRRTRRWRWQGAAGAVSSVLGLALAYFVWLRLRY